MNFIAVSFLQRPACDPSFQRGDEWAQAGSTRQCLFSPPEQ